MSTKCLLALALVAALVVLVTPYYINEDFEDEGEGGAMEEAAAQALPLFLQKRGRGMRFNRCIDQETGKRCICDRTRVHSVVGGCVPMHRM